MSAIPRLGAGNDSIKSNATAPLEIVTDTSDQHVVEKGSQGTEIEPLSRSGRRYSLEEEIERIDDEVGGPDLPLATEARKNDGIEVENPSENIPNTSIGERSLRSGKKEES